MTISVPAGIGFGAHEQYDLGNVIVTMTYSIVLFSIILQGATIGPMISRAKRIDAEEEAVLVVDRPSRVAAGDWPADA